MPRTAHSKGSAPWLGDLLLRGPSSESGRDEPVPSRGVVEFGGLLGRASRGEGPSALVGYFGILDETEDRLYASRPSATWLSDRIWTCSERSPADLTLLPGTHPPSKTIAGRSLCTRST